MFQKNTCATAMALSFPKKPSWLPFNLPLLTRAAKLSVFLFAQPLSFNQIEALTKSTESDYLLREQLSAQSRVKRIAEMAEEAGVPCETVVAQSTKPNEEIDSRTRRRARFLRLHLYGISRPKRSEHSYPHRQ